MPKLCKYEQIANMCRDLSTPTAHIGIACVLQIAHTKSTMTTNEYLAQSIKGMPPTVTDRAVLRSIVRVLKEGV